MPKTIDELETEVLGLPEQDRGRLLKALLLSLEEAREGDVADLWADEARARAEEIRRGDVAEFKRGRAFLQSKIGHLR